MPAPDGLLVVDKPADWTSHDVVARCRRLCGTRKVGHAGTLDPMATGVLVLGVGRATRLLGHLSLTDKAYDATIRLGQTTVTDDAEGEVVQETDASAATDEQLRAAVAALTGEIQQVPSAVSAIKIDGQRAYKRVRAGEEVALTPRPVTVSEFTIYAVRRSGGFVDVDVHVECTTGTYIRALARDVGAALGVGGHLTTLRRTRVGPFGLDVAHTLDELASEPQVLSMDDAAAVAFPTYTVSDEHVPAVRNGRAVHVRLGAVGPVAVTTGAGHFLALYEQHGPVAQAVAVFDPA
ncbi:MAG: tRNA pseudouridine(55) synthase TruB [Nocardioidaceae bacterium]